VRKQKHQYCRIHKDITIKRSLQSNYKIDFVTTFSCDILSQEDSFPPPEIISQQSLLLLDTEHFFPAVVYKFFSYMFCFSLTMPMNAVSLLLTGSTTAGSDVIIHNP
jgi:hypothetical protein